MSKKYCVFILVFLLVSCTQGTQSVQNNQSSISQNTAKTNASTPIPTSNAKIVLKERLEKKSILDEFRFYSQDYKNFINVKIEEKTNDDNSDIDVLLNDNYLVEKNSIYNAFKKQYHSQINCYSLDKENVVINGRYIFNISSKTKKNIDFLDSNTLTFNNYFVNPNATKIAYIVFETQDTKAIEKVIIYDISENTVKTIYEKELNHSYPVVYNIFWDKNDNIYFDTSNFKNYKNDAYEDYECVVYKYNITQKSLKEFYKGCRIETSSTNGQYLIMNYFNTNKHIVLDLSNSKQLYSFETEIFSVSDNGLLYNVNNDLILYSLEKLNQIATLKIDHPKDINKLDYYNNNFYYYRLNIDKFDLFLLYNEKS